MNVLKFPEKHWSYKNPEEVGLTDKFLDDLDEFIRKNSRRTKSFVVIKNGHIVFEESYHGGIRDEKYEQCSVTKSINSIVMGIAIDKGYINSEDDPVIKYIPEYADYGELNKGVTIKQLLQMSSGMTCRSQIIPTSGNFDYRSETKGSPMIVPVFNSNNPLESIMSIPISDADLNVYCYNTLQSYFIVEIIKKVIDETYEDFADKYLFSPMGIKDYRWISEVKHKGYSIGLKTLDLARFGLLMMNKGKWDEVQIVSSQWIEKTIVPGTVDFYGYQWWLDPNSSTYYATGKGGQGLICIPDKDIIIAGNCFTKEGHSLGMTVTDIFYNFIFKELQL